MSFSAARRNRFPSVLLQPLGHLSVSLESVVYRLVVEPANPNYDSDCDRPLNLPRSLTAIWRSLATATSQLGRRVPAFQYRTRQGTRMRTLVFFKRGDYTAPPSFSQRLPRADSAGIDRFPD
jgi:hypothetical protein